MWMTSCPGSARKRGGSWEFWKSQLVELSPASGEDCWLSLARGGLEQVSHGVGGRWKSQNRKNVYLSPLNSKVIKSFVPELRIRVFRVSRFLCSMYICYEHPMYISHIHVYGYGIQFSVFEISSYDLIDIVSLQNVEKHARYYIEPKRN